MLRGLLLGIITASIFTGSTVALAQDGRPRPDRQGDYYEGLWQQWRVVDRDRRGLQCRSGPGTNYRVIKRFARGKAVSVFTQGEENIIQVDARNLPWLAVLPTGYQYETPCFVRANSRFIQPIPHPQD